ncbi:MAG: methyltransferase domain-containing protein [Deltaproteobacteria bacterium]|nr:methyltransferase domain-containing protein [Deltaproteobacteria bacterium]
MVDSPACPVCGSDRYEPLYPIYAGPAVTSDFMAVTSAVIDNRCCRGCGLIYNAAGTRGDTDEFYRHTYRLMMHREEAEVKSFTPLADMSQARRSYVLLREMIGLAEKGALIEVGAGKGHFLTHLAAGLPWWSITALEPGAALESLRRNLPQAQVIPTGYHDFEAAEEAYDLAVGLGVLEHVPNPLDLLRWAWRSLKPGGHLFLRVPNFAYNPGDMFCIDHLSKLTEKTLKSLAGAAGFRVTGVREVGVPMFLALAKVDGPFDRLENCFDENLTVAGRNEALARHGIELIAQAREAARDRDENFAIFGLSSTGLFAPWLCGFDPKEITAYLDENQAVWGTRIHGRPVGGLGLIEQLGVRHLALAMSPIYIDAVKEKLRRYPVAVYV